MSGRKKFANWVVESWAGRALAVALCFTVVGLFFSLSMAADMGWRRSMQQSLAQFWAWGLVTPLIVLVDRRLPFSSKQLGRRAAAHFIAGLFFTAIYIYVFFVVRVLVGERSWTTLSLASVRKEGLDWYIWSMLVYWTIVGVIQALGYYRRFLTSELELERVGRSLSEARLNALRMQLDPHFLFNALNTISSHVERDPKLTRTMIEHLGDLLRMSLDSKDRHEVPLSEELAFLEHYLEIQKIRFGDQLQIHIQIAPEVRFALVPSLLLQPLVENAIRHGISRRASGGNVTVTAAKENERLEIRVLDDGAGLPPGWTLEICAGLGLAITRDRIVGLHPDGEGRLELHSRPGGGTIVEVNLPLQVIGEMAVEHAAD
ncbi:MAG TPA: histidine kinase [Terracidiphilus sp.]|nr:histidine kinase [Terracidiphilus sp.]